MAIKYLYLSIFIHFCQPWVSDLSILGASQIANSNGIRHKVLLTAYEHAVSTYTIVVCTVKNS